MLPRRKVLAASGTALPLFLTLNACAGPSPLTVLKGPPPLSSDVRALLDAASSEENLVYLYKKAIASYPALGPVLSPLLAEHQAHLRQLESRIIEPPGQALLVRPTVRPRILAKKAAAVTMLRDAEQAAITAYLRRLSGASPSEAQLYASIAASEFTHLTVLNGQNAG